MLLVGTTARPALAAPGEGSTPAVNPDLPIACGIDIHVILDESGSVQNVPTDVQQAFRAFTSALEEHRLEHGGVGVLHALPDFRSPARRQRAYTDRHRRDDRDDLRAVHHQQYRPRRQHATGRTAFRIGRYFLPRPSRWTPHLTVFITDGDPNKVVARTSDLRPGNRTPRRTSTSARCRSTDDETTSSRQQRPPSDRAVPKRQRRQGEGLAHPHRRGRQRARTSQSSLDRIIDVSGPDVFDGSGTFDIARTTSTGCRTSTTSRTRSARRPSSSAPRRSRSASCIDQTPDPGGRRLHPRRGLGDDGHGRPRAGRRGCCPPAPPATTATIDDRTRPASSTSSGTPRRRPARTITITEDGSARLRERPFSRRRAATGRPTSRPTRRSELHRHATAASAERCPTTRSSRVEMVNRRRRPTRRSPSRSRRTGRRRRRPRAPSSRSATPVTWTYLVTNTGNVTLSSIDVTDDQGVAVDLPGDAPCSRRRR